MNDKEGILRMQLSGRWAVCRPGHEPADIGTGDIFRVELEEGVLHVCRMEYAPGRGFYVIDGPELRDGLRAAICSGE